MNPRVLAVVGGVVVAAAIAIVAGPSIDVLEPYELTPGTEATLQIIVTERLRSDESSPWRQGDVVVTGPVGEGGVHRWPIVRVGYESVDAAGKRIHLDTDHVTADALELSGAELVRVALMEQLLDHPLQVGIDLRRGLVSLTGIDAALDSIGTGLEAAPELVETERAGLRSLLSDARLLEGARAAGFGTVTAEIKDQLLDVRREARFPVPGRGFATMHLVGYQGATRDRGNAVRFRGSLGPDEVFERNDEDVTPPQGVGDVLVEGVTGEGETEYLPTSLRPLRGRFLVAIPYRQGFEVTRQLEFVFIADQPR